MSAFGSSVTGTDTPTTYYGWDAGFSDTTATTVITWMWRVWYFDNPEPAGWALEVRTTNPHEARQLECRSMTRSALAWAVAHSDVTPPPALEARHGFQDAPRLPCYRGVRTR